MYSVVKRLETLHVSSQFTIFGANIIYFRTIRLSSTLTTSSNFSNNSTCPTTRRTLETLSMENSISTTIRTSTIQDFWSIGPNRQRRFTVWMMTSEAHRLNGIVQLGRAPSNCTSQIIWRIFAKI